MSWPSELVLNKNLILEDVEKILCSATHVASLGESCMEPLGSYISLIDLFENSQKRCEGLTLLCQELQLKCVSVLEDTNLPEQIKGFYIPDQREVLTEFKPDEVGDSWDSLNLGELNLEVDQVQEQVSKTASVTTLTDLLDSSQRSGWPSRGTTLPEYVASINRFITQSDHGIPVVVQKIDIAQLVDRLLSEDGAVHDYQNCKDYERDELEINGQLFKGSISLLSLYLNVQVRCALTVIL